MLYGVAPDAQDLDAILTERRHFADKTLSEYGSLRNSYSDRDERIRILDQILAGDWHVVWPDHIVDRALPKIPNYPRLARKHRVHLVAETMPTLTVRPSKMTDDAKTNAEQRERAIIGWQERSNVNLQIPEWAGDLIVTGTSAVKVLPDFTVSKDERFPLYQRIDPRTLYPGPTFTRGPWLDDAIISYEEKVPALEKRFGVDLAPLLRDAQKLGNAEASKLRVIEWYDDDRAMVIAESMFRQSPGRKKPFEVLLDERHGLSKCPVVIGVANTHDGAYRSPLDDGLAMLNTANRLVTLHIDSATRNVYATLVVDDSIENPEDEGPGAILHSTASGDVMSHIGYLTHPAGPYDNYQIMRQLDAALRTAFLLPPSVTGDPNESVTSAAGINATQTMPNAEVVSLQRDSIAPMLQAANELAIRADEKWADVKKTITGVVKGTPFAETYTPSKLFNGDYTNKVTYGMGAGLDQVNTSVMIKQDLGAGLMSRQSAMEKSPFTENPVEEMKRIMREQLTDAAFSGILAATQLPPGTPGAIDLPTLAAIWKDIESEGITIREALERHAERIALVQPQTPEQSMSGLTSPGMAGAAEPQPPSVSSPLEDLLV